MNSNERIELHIHSKFGGDSTVYPGEIIRKLNDRGIPAVAITDMSNIYAKPIEGGKSKYALSDEEKQAIEIATQK